MDNAHCPCGAPAVLLTDTLAICSADACAWSSIVTRQHRFGVGQWFETEPAGPWRRRWCTAEPMSC